MGHKWSYVIIINTYVNCGWHDSTHIETLLLYVFFLPKACAGFKKYFSSLAFRKAYSHTRRIYSYLRVVPAAMITEHHSLCIRSGDLACCNCLRKMFKLNPEMVFVGTSTGSSLTQAVVGPSN